MLVCSKGPVGGNLTYNGEVTTDRAGLRGERVSGTKEGAASLDDVLALPDHGTDGAGCHVYSSPYCQRANSVLGKA
jgi:hypothetical protein